jgi:hypothetical protein
MLLQGGKRVADIGVMYPFESLAGWYRFEDPDNPRQGFFVSPETDYLEISGLLTNEIRRDFTFIHPEYFLDEKYIIGEGSVTLDNKENVQAYKALIITGCNIVSYKTLEKIKAFYDAGGLVISTTQLPYKSAEMGGDQKIIDLVQQIFGIHALDQDTTLIQRNSNDQGGISVFIPKPDRSNMAETLGDKLAPDVEFVPDPQLASDFGKFSYIHKIKDGRDIYYFANSSDEKVETSVILRGKLKLEEWNPHNGKVEEINAESVERYDQPYTKIKLRLNPVKSVFFISE